MLAAAGPPDRIDEPKRRALVVAFLRNPPPRPTFSPDDAAATASAGYDLGIEFPWEPRDGQPPGYETLVKRGVIRQGSVSQFDVPKDAAPSPRESPRWEGDVVHGCDSAMARWERRFPKYLRSGVARALAKLSPLDREIVRLCATLYQTFRAAGAMVGRDHHTAIRHYYDALDQIISEIWTEDGEVRYDMLE